MYKEIIKKIEGTGYKKVKTKADNWSKSVNKVRYGVDLSDDVPIAFKVDSNFNRVTDMDDPIIVKTIKLIGIETKHVKPPDKQIPDEPKKSIKKKETIPEKEVPTNENPTPFTNNAEEPAQVTPPEEIQETKTPNIAVALCNVQKTELIAITDSENPFHHSKYADLSSVWAAIRKPITDNGLSVIQTTEPYDNGVTVITTLMHISGETITTKLSTRVPEKAPDKNGVAQSNIQSLGSAITYLRRYSLAAMVGVSTMDDDAESVVRKTKK